MLKEKVLCVILVLLLISCSEEIEFNDYYELGFKDEISTTFEKDSITIIIEQYDRGRYTSQEVSYDIIDRLNLGDTLNFKLDVKFGSYSKTPDPQRKFYTKNDTLFLWYSYYLPDNQSLLKTSSTTTITSIETSPLAPYYSIQKVTIEKSPGKNIAIERKIIR